MVAGAMVSSVSHRRVDERKKSSCIAAQPPGTQTAAISSIARDNVLLRRPGEAVAVLFEERPPTSARWVTGRVPCNPSDPLDATTCLCCLFLMYPTMQRGG